ncbi:MAG: DUF5606 domain-containing protein [Bacteroidales bacterium]|nr:DUF5606 domain-containing protein [Bacteroidales bacterium]
MATDLKKVLSISGQPGLFEYIAQARNGFVVEAMATKHRSSVPTTAKVTTLADVSIYTEDGEASLKKVLESMRDALEGKQAMSSKSNPDDIKKFFEKVLPGYDRDRFYVSHMKKVLDWYNCLVQYASLEFVEEEEEGAEGEKPAQEPAE